MSFLKTLMLLQINKVCRELTGYSHEVVEVLSHRLHCDFLSVCCASATAHLNLTHAQASVVLAPYLGEYLSPTWVWKKNVLPVLKASDRVGNLARTERRYTVREPNFILCTSIVDGLPLYSRGSSELYNGM